MDAGWQVPPDAYLHRSLLILILYQISIPLFNRSLAWAELMRKLEKLIGRDAMEEVCQSGSSASRGLYLNWRCLLATLFSLFNRPPHRVMQTNHAWCAWSDLNPQALVGPSINRL